MDHSLPHRSGDLAVIAQRYFGSVSYVGIDVDPELKYPKGAARITFCATKSYVAALTGRYMKIPHGDSVKQVGRLMWPGPPMSNGSSNPHIPGRAQAVHDRGTDVQQLLRASVCRPVRPVLLRGPVVPSIPGGSLSSSHLCLWGAAAQGRRTSVQCEYCWDVVHYSSMLKKRSSHRPFVRQGDQTKLLSRPLHHQTMAKADYSSSFPGV